MAVHGVSVGRARGECPRCVLVECGMGARRAPSACRLRPRGDCWVSVGMYRVRTELGGMRLGIFVGYERLEAVNDLPGTNDRL